MRRSSDHLHPAHKRLEVREMLEDLERAVLSRAVWWHIENRILLYGNKTVIFA